jgi:hypothetical protein
MLGANELRIGNLVLDDTSENIMIVSRIESADHTEWNSGDQYNIRCLQFGTRETYYDGNFKPIPLTEEWLLKLGLFKITKKEDLWGNDEIGVYDFNGKIRCSDFFITSNTLKDFTLYVATIDDGMESAESLNNIIYVHQLQNLYFCLCGEELTIENL